MASSLFDIFNYAGDTVAFKFTAVREFGSLYSGLDSRISIDDFSVYEDTMTCDKPIKVELTSIGVSNAQITWSPQVLLPMKYNGDNQQQLLLGVQQP